MDAEIKWLAASNTGSLWQSQKLIHELLIPILCLNQKTIMSSNLYYYFVPVYIVCFQHILLKELSTPLENTSSYLLQPPCSASQAVTPPKSGWMSRSPFHHCSKTCSTDSPPRASPINTSPQTSHHLPTS